MLVEFRRWLAAQSLGVFVAVNLEIAIGKGCLLADAASGKNVAKALADAERIEAILSAEHARRFPQAVAK